MNDDPTTKRRIRRLVKVLHARGWYSRQDILDALDKDAPLTAIRGVGPTLAKTLAALLQLSDEEFAQVTEMSN